MRLDKFLGLFEIGTRKQIKEYLKNGRCSVNGEVVTKPDIHVDENNDEISFDGKTLRYSKYHYYMLYKPQGVVSATTDGRNTTVLDLLQEENVKGLSPAGRLDIDTEGLLLLTDDGGLIHRLLSPKKHVDKVYRVSVDTPLDEKEISLFKEGIVLSDFTCLPAELNILTKYEAEVTICEGKYHQVKRMFKALGHNVISLKRLRFGKFTLPSDLSEGEYIMISPFEKNA